ncbi:flagellar motor protein MotB [uncultured Desulfobulbus sp.]|uniref:flagellar motor protein MotB n=1 Tax=uncultured Desulfobulbus sp. TaxID=239745 RepID=UPI0029C99371|nr:flagellar motor protein MotB [uncultured Desulfobulbus sp.]
MARKKEPEKAANHERWLVSYADFITLLFAVFVTLYAMSQTDKQKVEQVAASYRSAFGVTVGASSGKPQFIPKSDMMPIPSMKQQLKNTEKPKAKGDGSSKVQATKKDFKEMLVSLEKFLIDKNAQDKVNIDITRRGLVISLREAGFFDSGSATIQPAAYELLTKIAEVLLPYGNPISFEGHTDNIPMRSSTFHSNWELSTARATTLAHYFMDRHSFAPEKISVTGYGEYRPVADNSVEEGRKQNRRVDVVLVGATEGEIEEPAPAEEAPPKKLPF